METKKHLLAQKKVNGAVSTFTAAVSEIDKAVALIEVSVEADKGRLLEIDNKITSLQNAHDQVQANILSKQGEIKKYIDLSIRLGEFTL